MQISHFLLKKTAKIVNSVVLWMYPKGQNKRLVVNYQEVNVIIWHDINHQQCYRNLRHQMPFRVQYGLTIIELPEKRLFPQRAGYLHTWVWQSPCQTTSEAAEVTAQTCRYRRQRGKRAGVRETQGAEPLSREDVPLSAGGLVFTQIRNLKNVLGGNGQIPPTNWVY